MGGAKSDATQRRPRGLYDFDPARTRWISSTSLHALGHLKVFTLSLGNPLFIASKPVQIFLHPL
jgi:hypothetical protein